MQSKVCFKMKKISLSLGMKQYKLMILGANVGQESVEELLEIQTNNHLFFGYFHKTQSLFLPITCAKQFPIRGQVSYLSPRSLWGETDNGQQNLLFSMGCYIHQYFSEQTYASTSSTYLYRDSLLSQSQKHLVRESAKQVTLMTCQEGLLA